jgi:alpha-beta hydrolase superfamily lysophospholipase
MKKILYFIFTKSVGLYINLLGYVFPKKAIKLAYSLFSEPRDGRLVKNNLPQILLDSTPTSYQYKKEQFQTYTWEGNETVILLLHGWESNASRWEKLLPYLRASGSTIIAIDAPAHGLSSGKEFNIPQYASYVDIIVQKFKPKYLIGHSLGAKSCLYYQATYQNQGVEKIVILGSPSDFTIILNNYINMLSLNTKIASGLAAFYFDNFNITLKNFAAKHFATVITSKGFIAHDRHDTVVLFQEGQKIADAWKDAIFIETSGLGHSMQDENLYEKICQFLFD